MQLDIPAGISTGTAGSIELEQSSGSAVRTHTAFRRLIFLHRAFCHLEPELQHIHCLSIYSVLVQLFDHLGYILFSERVHRDAALLQPCLQLRYGIRVFKSRQLVGFPAHGIGEHQVAGDCFLHQLRIDSHAAVIDALIRAIMLPFQFRHWELFQSLIDVYLGIDILNAVILELCPVRRVMLRKIPGPHPVGFRRLARYRKQLDEPLTFFVFLLAGLQHRTDIFQCQRQSQRCCHDHRADPAIRRKELSRFQILSGIVPVQMHGEADTLKGGIVCDQPHIAGLECLQQFIRYDFSRCKVCTSCLAKAIPFIGCPGYQQDFKAGICGIAVQTAFSDIHLAVGLNIDQYLFQKITPYLRKNRETPLHLPACSFTCVLETPGLTSDNPAVPHRRLRPEHPHHLPAHQSQHLQMHVQTDGHRP